MGDRSISMNSSCRPAEEIGGIESVLTMVGGRIAYGAGSYAALDEKRRRMRGRAARGIEPCFPHEERRAVASRRGDPRTAQKSARRQPESLQIPRCSGVALAPLARQTDFDEIRDRHSRGHGTPW
jgi:hypothetical protein